MLAACFMFVLSGLAAAAAEDVVLISWPDGHSSSCPPPDYHLVSESNSKPWTTYISSLMYQVMLYTRTQYPSFVYKKLVIASNQTIQKCVTPYFLIQPYVFTYPCQSIFFQVKSSFPDIGWLIAVNPVFMLEVSVQDSFLPFTDYCHPNHIAVYDVSHDRDGNLKKISPGYMYN